ncbi:polysaccharide biosynthesis tyrosine autokinase [Marmoricola endophyticus]|uniref:polysaccharide biosynthesis tyrosine autokinase n=1 Tax=Marmoricola endophyticus TaxID=2040280 RepID=UPI00166F00D6|nr:polysaccharide biosynthesis tyrosine autokinase [Marmoricola endophyticus]
MELRDYLRIVRRRWRVILACLVLVVAVAGVLTARATPQYQSSTQLFVSSAQSSGDDDSSGSAYQGGLAATQRVTSYAQLVTQGELTSQVIDDLDLDLTPSQLAEKITATAQPDTVLLKIQVTDPDPKLAQRICGALATDLQATIKDIETPPGMKRPLLKGTITDPASLPTSPVSPQVERNIGLAVVLGLLLGLGLAVVRELLDTSVKTAEQVSDTLEAPVVGGVSFDSAIAKHPLVTDLSSHAPRVEAFRVLRTNLQFVDIDSGSKVIVFTSSVPGEGKSTTSVNVALSMAQAGQRVLLVDGDLRRPQVANLLELEPAVGVTTVLLGRVDLAEAVQRHSSGLEVLTSGSTPPNPAELLQSRAMAELLTRLRDEYDVVIVDSPPLLPVTDAALMANQTDGAILVVRHGSTTRDQLSGAAERLRAVGARPLGAVLNRVPAKGGRYGYGYGYGYGYAPDLTGHAKSRRARRRDRRRNEPSTPPPEIFTDPQPEPAPESASWSAPEPQTAQEPSPQYAEPQQLAPRMPPPPSPRPDDERRRQDWDARWPPDETEWDAPAQPEEEYWGPRS